MTRLEDLKRGALVRGISPGKTVTVVDVTWHGSNAIELIYKDEAGRAGNQLLFRESEPGLELVVDGQPWSFEAEGDLLRLVSEAQRIRWAHLFDPFVAVNTSMVEPLPHQITAVYEEMLPRQPLRFMLADDPGAGKTIMTGLFIKELVIRGDLSRCLIVCPGSLVEQWQDELYQKFSLPFDILTRDLAESARSGNIFNERQLLIARLDQLARGDDLRAQLDQTDWDLIVCDEAHKMSATFFSNEVHYTKRFHLGRQLAQLTRHFLLLTATPHNGKEADFQLFMSLLDEDRFEGKYREGVHTTQALDLMRRMVKERLVKFDGTPLFPERRAYTVPYELSDDEAVLYREVTDYVRHEFDRVERMGDEGRRGTVGFALTILQRRLASSPEAIYQSLRRRRERLESHLREAELEHRALGIQMQRLDEDEIEDLEEALADDFEEVEETLVDQATTALTAEELRLEIARLKELEDLAQTVRRSGQDRKWEELSRLLVEEEMYDEEGNRRKLVIFTEHRDTLNYLAENIRTLLGRPEAVVIIHGGIRRDERRHTQRAFTQDPTVQILVATDAAGEGINLQRAHLMINYDLPWNPNRIEQRFGRIHRIGQTEVCHCWNLLAEETREGDVYKLLLRKLERERQALGGAVFDVLGKAIAGKELRQLMLEAIRYGDRPEVRARLHKRVEGALDHERLRTLMEEKALAHDIMDAGHVYRIKQEMERVQARRLQPHYIASFFREAFTRLGGTLYEREQGRYEATYVPALIRQRSRQIGVQEHVLTRYERICFDKACMHVDGRPAAELVAPGHPLLDTVIDLILERYRYLMKQGAVLLDEADPGEKLRALLYLEHAVEDGRTRASGQPLLASRRFQFAEIDLADVAHHEIPTVRDAGPAPYLNYRPLTEEEQALVAAHVEQARAGVDLEQAAVSFAIRSIVPEHLAEVQRVREPRIERAIAAVKDRLTKEIMYWDHRAEELKAKEEAGKVTTRMNAAKARQRADALEARLQHRLAELEQERQLAARPPAVLGGALVVPGGLLKRLRGERQTTPARFARETKRVERAAMDAVLAIEQAMGNVPRDVGALKLGYDVESREPGDEGGLRFIEVKGRIAGAETVTITRNEILTGLNKPDEWILALVEVPLAEDFPETDAFVVGDPDGDYGTARTLPLRYVRQPFQQEPDFGATSVNYDWQTLWERGVDPLAGVVKSFAEAGG